MKYASCSILTLMLYTSPLLATEAELIIEDDEGDEVLRLDPDDTSSGLQRLPAGRYKLKVDGPGEFELILGERTELEFRGGEVPTIETQLSTDDSPILIDFDPDEGDQLQRRAIVEGAGDEVELQLCALDVPEIYGWSVMIEYDSDQVRYLSNSFQPSDFVPELIPLVDERDASVEVGGANFSKKITSGNGELGTLRFAVLDGFKGETGLKVTRFSRRTLTSTEVISVETVALITNQETLDQVSGLDLAGAAAIDHLDEDNACPGCDLIGANLMRKHLPKADLTQADLSDANLSMANLSEVNFIDARLVGANLRMSNLRGADLRRALLRDAKLTGAKLQKANLQGAILDDANLKGANLSGAIWIDGRECGPGSIGHCK